MAGHHDTVVLICLARHGFGLTREEVAERTPLSPDSVSQSFRRLRKTGMVRRTPTTTDRYEIDTTRSI